MTNHEFELDDKTYVTVTPCCKKPLLYEACCMTHSTGTCSGCYGKLDSRVVWTIVMDKAELDDG